MNRVVPRTAAARADQARAPQPPEARRQQAAATSAAADTDSPRDVLTALPLSRHPRAKTSAKQPRAPEQSMAALEGHAVDVLQLLNSAWFGPLSRSKAAELFRREQPEAEPGLPPRRGRKQQQQQQQAAAAAARGERTSDASPTSSSQRSGSSSQVAAAGGDSRGHAAQAAAGPSSQQQAAAQAAAIQHLPGIGTWAGRYRLFGGQQPADAKAAAAAAMQRQRQRQAPSPSDPSLAAGGTRPGDGDQQRASSHENDSSPVVLRPGAAFGAPHPAAADEALPDREQRLVRCGSEEDAWRWRFSRKWACEQKRYYEQPEVPTSMVSDDLDAMEFTQACGMGLDLQVLPTRRPLKHAASIEEEGALGIDNSVSTLSLCQFDVDHSETALGLLSAEMSPCNSTHGAVAAGRLLNRTTSGSGLPRPPQQAQQAQQQAQQQEGGPSPRLPSATKSVLSMANRARELLRRQGVIEQEVQDRWESGATSGDAWAGRALKGVLIDMRGRFKYCVLRVSDGTGRTRFIVRGRSGATPATLLESASLEAAEASRSGPLPAVVVEIVGAGIMEWREDTERELHLMPITLPPGQVASLDPGRGGMPSGGSPTKAAFLGDVTGLTASLVRQALPCHFRITTAASLSRPSAGSATVRNRV
ncbi:hypothetical protein ACK3TF_005430 [Chlorella vulgaris]